MPAVKTHNGSLYILDRHHMSTALLQSKWKELPVTVCVVDSMEEISPSQFWENMRAKNYLWPNDEHAQPVSPLQFPPFIDYIEFHDDPYRNLAEWVGACFLVTSSLFSNSTRRYETTADLSR